MSDKKKQKQQKKTTCISTFCVGDLNAKCRNFTFCVDDQREILTKYFALISAISIKMQKCRKIKTQAVILIYPAV